MNPYERAQWFLTEADDNEPVTTAAQIEARDRWMSMTLELATALLRERTRSFRDAHE